MLIMLIFSFPFLPYAALCQETLDVITFQSEGEEFALPEFLDSVEVPSQLRTVIPPTISGESNNGFEPEEIPTFQPKQKPLFDIPIVENSRVRAFITYFQITLKDKFSNWLALSSKYIPLMKTLFRQKGLPEDLVYLSLVESGFNPYAYSKSKAAGLWQFISPGNGTG